jgi:hypothetical protein
MDNLTTTIQREFLRDIVNGSKTVEYREIKPYWSKRLDGIPTPFTLRLINGMSATAPEVTVQVDRVRKNTRTGNFELHIAKVLNVRNWDRVRERPVA